MAKAATSSKYQLADANRWRSYRSGILNHPAVREAELSETLALLDPQPGEKVLEIGAGSGYLSLPIAKALAPNGHLTAADINPEGLAQLATYAEQLPLSTFLFSSDLYQQDKFSELEASSYDAICTLAAFHHFDNRVDDSGELGRAAFLKEAYQLLKPGGRLIIVDVGGQTPTQAYFDAIDDPYYFAPDGHPHNFHTPDELKTLAQSIGFEVNQSEIRQVPWVFDNLPQAQSFIHTIHNAQCPQEESFDLAKSILGVTENQNRYILNWQLMFFSATRT